MVLLTLSNIVLFEKTERNKKMNKVFSFAMLSLTGAQNQDSARKAVPETLMGMEKNPDKVNLQIQK